MFFFPPDWKAKSLLRLEFDAVNFLRVRNLLNTILRKRNFGLASAQGFNLGEGG
jgi:hypothetical protein